MPNDAKDEITKAIAETVSRVMTNILAEAEKIPAEDFKQQSRQTRALVASTWAKCETIYRNPLIPEPEKKALKARMTDFFKGHENLDPIGEFTKQKETLYFSTDDEKVTTALVYLGQELNAHREWLLEELEVIEQIADLAVTGDQSATQKEALKVMFDISITIPDLLPFALAPDVNEKLQQALQAEKSREEPEFFNAKKPSKFKHHKGNNSTP